ncbi:MAG: YecA family protein, partial [Acinetobacter sp.]
GEESYQELYEFVRLIPVSLSLGRKKVEIAEIPLLKKIQPQLKSAAPTEPNSVVEMFTPHRPS